MGDDLDPLATTAMPLSCPKWPCSTMPAKARLVTNERGFQVCPLCGGSYGKNEPDWVIPYYDALCLREPWLELILLGLKTLETRTRCLRKHGGEFVLTSATVIDEAAWENPAVGGRLDQEARSRARQGLGQLAALVTFGDARLGVPGQDDAAACIDINGPYGPRWVWPITNVRRLVRRPVQRLRPEFRSLGRQWHQGKFSEVLTPGASQGLFKVPQAHVQVVDAA